MNTGWDVCFRLCSLDFSFFSSEGRLEYTTLFQYNLSGVYGLKLFENNQLSLIFNTHLKKVLYTRSKRLMYACDIAAGSPYMRDEYLMNISQ